MNKCKSCTYNCSGMCAKDWEPLDDNHQVSIFEWIAVLFLVLVVLWGWL